MIDRFLRRLRVRPRIFGVFILTIVVSTTLLSFVLISMRHLLNEQRVMSESLSQANHLVSRAAIRVSSSRANLLEYQQGREDGIDQARNDIYRAQVYMDAVQTANGFPTSSKLAVFRIKLADYQALISKLQSEAYERDNPAIDQLVDEVLQYGADIVLEIEGISQIYDESFIDAQSQMDDVVRRRIYTLSGIFTALTLVTFVIVFFVLRSITHSVNLLYSGAEGIRQGHYETTFDESGTDEFSSLAKTFNQMTSQLIEKNQELEQRVAERTNDLYKQTANLQAIVDISRVTTEILDLNDLLQQAVNVISQRFKLYYVGLFLIEEETRNAVLRAGTGDIGKMLLDRGHKLRTGQGMIGWCIEKGQARVSQDAKSDQVRIITPELSGTRSEAAIPLHSRGRIIGALTIQDDEVGAFDNTQIELLQVMADLLATIIENTKLYTETQNTLLAARAAYSQMTREGWLKQMHRRDIGYRSSVLGDILATEGEWDSVMKYCLEMQQPQSVDEGYTLVLPLRVRDSVIGVLRMKKPRQRNAWTNHEINLMETIADQIGVALENARLYEDSQQREFEERLIREASERMREPLELRDILQITAEEMREMLDLEDVVIHLSMPDSD